MSMEPSSTITSIHSSNPNSLHRWGRRSPSAAVEPTAGRPDAAGARAEEALSRDVGESVPGVPPEWSVTANVLSNLARASVPAPPWWKTEARFRAGIETWIGRDGRAEGEQAIEDAGDGASVILLLTLAGCGQLQIAGDEPLRVGPGQAFVAANSRDVDLRAAQDTPAWTFVRVEILHPYLQSRLGPVIRRIGPVIDVRPSDTLTTSSIRLARGAIIKDFQDEFDAEMALFDFTMAFERWARRLSVGARDAELLIEDVRMQVLARLPRAVEVSSIAEKFGMSRSYFSHVFRDQTGLTPAHFATEVRIQKVERMLLDTREPLKTIAAACGFANANHLCKVFRRFRRCTPTAFRRELGLSTRSDIVEALRRD
jgi:AraC-like DNA-binding protein